MAAGTMSVSHPTRRPALLFAAVALGCCTHAGSGNAATLADRLHLLISDNSYLFTGANFDSLTPAIERIAVRGTDLPAVSTAPGFTYVFDPELGTPVRSTGSLGPVFLERADTVGRHVLLLGASYEYANLDNLDGHDSASQLFFLNSAFGFENAAGQPLRVDNRFTFDDFAVRANGGTVSATYGVTDALDVNVLLPLLQTALDVEATTQNFTVNLADHSVTPDQPRHVSLHADAFGVGDLLLRAKYHLVHAAEGDMATGLSLRVPTGSEGDFRGLGDWTVTPVLLFSRALGAHDVHGNVGFEFDADKIERSRVQYGIGVTLQPLERLAVLLDVVGSSGIAPDNFTQDGVALAGSRFDGPFQTRVAVAGSGAVVAPVHFDSLVPRTDVLDLAAGFKVSVTDRALAFLGVLVPLTSDGLRAAVVPTGGLEYTF